ncbi:MAG: hypothetical protein ABI629_12175 [bacterium]
MSQLDPTLPPDAERFVARLRADYAPPPRDALQHAAFTRAVQRRVRRRTVWVWPPLLAATAATALALWMVLPGQPTPPSVSHGHALLALALTDDDPTNADDILPADYVDIAEALEL